MMGRPLTLQPSDTAAPHLSFGVPGVDVLPPPVEGRHHVQIRVVVHGQDHVGGVGQRQQHRRRLHGTHQHLVSETQPNVTASSASSWFTAGRSHTHMSLGWYCSLRMGDGKRNLWSQSPVRTSHWETMLSVEALTSLCPSRLQLTRRTTTATQQSWSPF